MKNKLKGVLAVGLTLVMVLALTASFALPVGASPDENAWSKFAYPAEGETGGWFYDPTISGVGPIAKAIDGSLYAATDPSPTCSQKDSELKTWGEGSAAVWSTEDSHSGSYSAKLTIPAGDPWVNNTNVWVYYGDALSTIDNADFTYWYWQASYGALYGGLYIDTEGDDGVIDRVLSSQRAATNTVEETWTETAQVDLWAEVECDSAGNPAGTQSGWQTLAEWQEEYSDATLVYVAAAWGYYGGNERVIYIDDITIGGTTWNLEKDPEGEIDGSGLAYGLRTCLMKSTDGGRSWAETYYSHPTYGVEGGTIVAIACSSIDEDVVYVADGKYVYKTEDGGDTFDFVSKSTLEDHTLEPITCMDVGYADEEPHVYIGTADGSAGGAVAYIYDVAFGGGWTNLELDYSVYGIGASPDFESDALVVAVATDGSETFACSNYGAAPGAWDEVELEDEDGISYAITEASDPAFPEDFDADDPEFFVGVVGPAHDGGDGGVYRVYDSSFYLLDYVDMDIISLDLVGEVGDTLLLAGAQDTADVWWSTDDGDTWKNAADYGLPPTGGGPTYVVMDDDFADNDTAWAATTGAEAAVSLSVDGGEIWHGISLISTDIDKVVGVALSPAYATDETLFLLTSADAPEDTESVFKYDGANWERVFESTLYEADEKANLVAVSPDFATEETVFVGCTEDGAIFRSTNAGISFLKQRVEPDKLTWWVIIDSDTIIAGGNGEVHKTENYGRRTWTTYDVVGAGTVASFAVVGDTIMLGDDAGQVFVSEDAGEEWEQVGDAKSDIGPAVAPALVAFDGDIIYVTFLNKAVVGRCVIDTDEDWADQLWEEFTDPRSVTADQALDLNAAAGIVISPDGTLYVVDAKPDTSKEEAGVWRCLNPDEEYEDDAAFELVNYKLSDTAELGLAGFSVGTNVLWATNAEVGEEDELWTYEDTLVTGVILSSPVSGMAVTDTDKATLEWFELTGAAEYEIEVNTRDDFLGTPIAVDDTELTWAVAEGTDGLDPGTTYYWRVRAAEDKPLWSRWSETRSFITALERVAPPVTMWSPDIGADDVVLSPVFSWGEVTGATSYKIIVATEPSFAVANRIVETMVITNFYPCDVRLSYNTTYYWRVKAFSDSVVVSDWQAGMFTTMPRPVPPTPPVEITPAPPAPEIEVVVPAPEVIVPPAQVIAPTWLYVIIGIGAVLVIAVIVLIVRTRRVT